MTLASRASLGRAIQNAVPAVHSVADLTRELLPASPREVPVIVEATSPLDLDEWIRPNLPRVQARLLEYGSVLFRGFEAPSEAVFGAVADAIGGPRLEYANRASPRTTVGDRIYTSTDYPRHLPIFPHNEHGYSPVFPRYLFFCCFEPATTGGATPIGSTRQVAASIPEALRRRFRERGILYLRNYHEGFGLSWRKAFQTDRRDEVERYCRERGIQFEWREGGVLRTRRVGPAEVTHPETGERVWFNHATFYHVSTLPLEIRRELLADFDLDELPNHTYYGDGAAIEDSVLDELRAAYTGNMQRFDWRRGDLLAADNLLTVHAREPFTGPRRILVSMADELRAG